MTSKKGIPSTSAIRNAAEPMIGGNIWPPVLAIDSIAAAYRDSIPSDFISGIVNDPVVATLAAELPMMEPMSMLEMTAV
jgi:hypothetical protein